MEAFMEHKRDFIVISILVLFICISIGYAMLSSNLSINGASQINDASWDIHWENIQVTDGSVTAITEPTVDSGRTTVTYEVHFDTPGQFYEFTVDAKNDGTIDGMINTINSTLNGNPISTLPNYLIYSVSYIDGAAIQVKQPLDAGQKETYQVRIEYKKDIQVSDLPSSDQDLTLSFTVTYVQKDSTAVPIDHPSLFETEDWPTIIQSIRGGHPEKYRVGDTREIDMGSLGTHTIRVSNNSTPDVCQQEGFSQTACGFVVEFADIITTQRMNDDDAGSTGWPGCFMRSYVNDVIYNSLPSDVRDSIIDTFVVSGELYYSTIYDSIDKIYLLSQTEVWGNTSTGSYTFNDYDAVKDYTRQLDYYSNIVTDNMDYSIIAKTGHGRNFWWMRTCQFSSFYGMNASGKTFIISAVNGEGVSPAFRIG